MKSKAGVYQSEEYKKALKSAGASLVEFSGKYSLVRELKALGTRKRILETRGNFSQEELGEFKNLSKDYFYGTIAAPSVQADNSHFTDAKYLKVENNTILIDLKKSEEDLWQALEKKSIRWGIKTAEKKGLVVESQVSSKDIEEFYELYAKTASDGGFSPESKEFIRELIKTKVSSLLLVKLENRIVAGGLILFDYDFNYSILDLTASSQQGLELQAMPFLYWNMILLSKRKKLEYFDLGGYDTGASAGSKLYNINKFKERFGGDIVVQPIFCTNSKYKSLRKVMNSFKFLKGVYRKE